MSRLPFRFLTVLLLTAYLPCFAFAQSDARRPPDDSSSPRVMDASRFDPTLSVSNGVISSAKAATDSFYLYGGPGTYEGTFEGPSGVPDAQGWTGVDLTEAYPHWRASTTNAATLGGGTLGNHAVICHQDQTAFGGDPYTGYGNNWNDALVLRIDLAALGYDPSQDLVDLRWSFDYVHDLEDGYDWFVTESNQGGAWQFLEFATGSTYVDSTGVYEPVRFDSGTMPFSPDDYSNGEIQLRIRVVTDGGWSDEDGKYISEGRGAAAVDDIEVYLNDVLVSYAGWEPVGLKADLPPGEITGHDNGSATGTEGWRPIPLDFVGDFSKLIFGFEDIDPCRENRSWQYGFIDDGTPANNDPDQRSTAGSVSGTWSYGVPGGWVVNYTGGLTGGSNVLNNFIISPEIEWDLPGTDDDGAWGCVFSVDEWRHMPRSTCIFAVFQMRSYSSTTGIWSPWDAEWIWRHDTPHYNHFVQDVTTLLGPNPEKVQLRMGVWHLPWRAECGLPDATPAPLFDNISVKKYALEGPVVRFPGGFDAPIYDHFPTDGTPDGSIRWDPFTGWQDSMVIEILPVNRGTQLADPVHGGTMQVAMLTNPEFGDHLSGARAAALQQLGAVPMGQDARDWPIYSFAVEGQVSTHANGTVEENTYFFDLPDGPALPDYPHLIDEHPLLFRGDVVHYYIESTDDTGSTGRFPADTTDFLDFELGSVYPVLTTVRCFPNRNGGSTPKMLVWDNRPAQPQLRRLALTQAGFTERVDFDYYGGRWLSGSGDLSMELASAYETILIYESSSDSVDLQFLVDWRAQPGNRQLVWMSRWAAGNLNEESMGQDFLTSVLGVDYRAWSVRSFLDDQGSAEVVPTAPCFTSSFTAAAGCPRLELYNYVAPMSGAELSHEYLDPGGNPYTPSIAAGIIWPREEMGFDKSTAFFPLGLNLIWDPRGNDETGDGTAARARLLRETLQCMGIHGSIPVDTGSPSLRFSMQQNVPNPFNPNTRISYTVAHREHVELIVYDVAGRTVRTLVDGVKTPGPYFVDWDASDDAGARVASGIYHYRLLAGDFEEMKRMVLIK